MVKINYYRVERVTRVQCQEFDPEDFRKCEPPYEGSTDEDFFDYIEELDWDDIDQEIYEKYDMEDIEQFEDDYEVDPQSDEEDSTLVEEGSWDERIFNRFVDWKKKQ